jgi:molybdopterin synthase sulfur carrier subunit
VTIRYFADIRALTGCGEETWTKAAPDMRSLLEGLAAKHGSAFGKRVFEGDQLHSTIIIFINGRDVAHLKGIDSPLGCDDVVAIFPMVAGG